MNRKRSFLLAGAFVAVSAALFGVKWKQSNPTPTAEDEMIRQRLLSAKAVYIYRGATPGKADSIYYILLPADREEIASHIFLRESIKSYTNASARSFELCWGTFKDCPERIYVDAKSSYNIYENAESVALSRLVHPVTRAYLQDWIKHQPSIQKQLAKN